MKKEIIILILLILLVLPLSSAIDIEFNKVTYQPRDVLLATIEGNIVGGIPKENIFFMDDRVQAPMKYNVARFLDKYYIYAILPNTRKNYTLRIENLHYFEEGEDKINDLQKNFTIEGNITEFTPDTGFIITQDDFEIEVESNRRGITVTSEIAGLSSQRYIPAGQKKKFTYSITGLEQFVITTLTFTSDPGAQSTTIPVQIITPEQNITYPEQNTTINQTTNITIESNISTLEFPTNNVTSSIKVGEPSKYNIYLSNTGNQTISNIQIEKDSDIITSIVPSSFDLGPQEYKYINFTLLSSTQGTYDIEVTASSGNHEAKLYFNIEVTTENTSSQQTCVSIGGNICPTGYFCSQGIVQTTVDGSCCINGGICSLTSSSSSSSGGGTEGDSNTTTYILIILIVAVLGGIGYFVYKKYKSRKVPDKMKTTTKKFEQRFKPREKPTAVRGKITRI
ncbi:MAG: hypothetical protein KKF56_04820 [Nanoarchaeota archaeon]|nr:hypothetical protein [Nanoarchaeota archaeon]